MSANRVSFEVSPYAGRYQHACPCHAEQPTDLTRAAAEAPRTGAVPCTYTDSFNMKWLKHVSNPHREGLTHIEYGERQVGKCSFHLSGSANPETAYGLVDGERYRGRERFGRARDPYPDMLRGSYAPGLLSMPIGALPATPNATKPRNSA